MSASQEEIWSVVVNVRMSCGAYVARCNGKTASATADAESAAARAAAKHFGTIDTKVRLKPVTHMTFFAVPAADAPSDYKSANDLVRERCEQVYGPKR
jgi:hypothetical protein